VGCFHGLIDWVGCSTQSGKGYDLSINDLFSRRMVKGYGFQAFNNTLTELVMHSVTFLILNECICTNMEFRISKFGSHYLSSNYELQNWNWNLELELKIRIRIGMRSGDMDEDRSFHNIDVYELFIGAGCNRVVNPVAWGPSG
jgi:hypothetical protein